MKKSEKFLLESSVLLATVSMKAKKAGKSIKEYLYEAETIKHISLVLYDLLPLSVKIGLRYEKFNEIFERNFKAIRDALLGKEQTQEINPIKETIEVELKKEENVVELNKEKQVKAPVKRVRKSPAKKPVPKKVKVEK